MHPQIRITSNKNTITTNTHIRITRSHYQKHTQQATTNKTFDHKSFYYYGNKLYNKTILSFKNFNIMNNIFKTQIKTWI